MKTPELPIKIHALVRFGTYSVCVYVIQHRPEVFGLLYHQDNLAMDAGRGTG